MQEDRYYVLSEKILPGVFKKVFETKELLVTGKAKDICDATKQTGISRSTYYKYKDDIVLMENRMHSKKITLVVLLNHGAGALSKVLDCIAFNKGNIITINQDIPINMVANVTITLDISNMKKDVKQLAMIIKGLPNVVGVKLLATE